MFGRFRATMILAGVALIWSICLPGCGSGKSKVSGKVTLNGAAVVWGTVTLVDKNGEYHQADIDLSGNYEIDNVPAGPVKIAVVSPNPEPDPAQGRGGRTGKANPGAGSGAGFEDPRAKFMAGKAPAEDGRPKPPPGAWFPIPPNYNSPEESGLTGEVKGSKATLNIELK